MPKILGWTWSICCSSRWTPHPEDTTRQEFFCPPPAYQLYFKSNLKHMVQLLLKFKKLNLQRPPTPLPLHPAWIALNSDEVEKNDQLSCRSRPPAPLQTTLESAWHDNENLNFAYRQNHQKRPQQSAFQRDLTISHLWKIHKSQPDMKFFGSGLSNMVYRRETWKTSCSLELRVHCWSNAHQLFLLFKDPLQWKHSVFLFFLTCLTKQISLKFALLSVSLFKLVWKRM